MNSFYRISKYKCYKFFFVFFFFFSVGRVRGWVRKCFFFTKNPNLKKKLFFFFWGGGGGGGARVNDFLQRI